MDDKDGKIPTHIPSQGNTQQVVKTGNEQVMLVDDTHVPLQVQSNQYLATNGNIRTATQKRVSTTQGQNGTIRGHHYHS